MQVNQIKSVLTTTKFLSRNEKLKPWMLGRSFLVYDGKHYLKVEVVSLRLNKKAGEYVLTRKFPKHKKKVRK